MSQRYFGAQVNATRPAPSSTSASGLWTPQAQLQSAGNWPVQYPLVQEVFSTTLYTGTGAAQTITNGVDLTKGGLVWQKSRTGDSHYLIDTVRGSNKLLYTDVNSLEGNYGQIITAFNSSGFDAGMYYTSGTTVASWTFREQAKFFDVLTFTGTGATQTVAHNLGSVPGCIIVKRTDANGNWMVYHRGITATQYIVMNSTAIAVSDSTVWNSTEPTSSVFTVGTHADVNTSGGTYVAYIFAHNAGGFGVGGSESAIACGNYTGNSGTLYIELGWEPQFLLLKRVSGTTGNWIMVDTARRFDASGYNAIYSQSSVTEALSQTNINLTSTGFRPVASTITNFNGHNFIYIAVRRPWFDTPTTGTSVFSPVYRTGTGAATTVSVGFSPDSAFSLETSSGLRTVFDRIRGPNNYFFLNYQDAQTAGTNEISSWNPDGVSMSGAGGNTNSSTNTYAMYFLKRARGFFDEVFYIGTGADLTLNHALGVEPELILTKARSTTSDWGVYAKPLGIGSTTGLLFNNSTATAATYAPPVTAVSPTTFTARASNFGTLNATYISYMFATLPGISKVGTYTGANANQTIDCGFTSGARFIMLKRTDLSTSPWFFYDTARGITTGNDPYMLNNQGAVGAQVTNTDYITPQSVGFGLKALGSVTNTPNDPGGTYIYLAIA